MSVKEMRDSVIFGGRCIAWLYSPVFGLIELVEERAPEAAPCPIST